MREKSDRGGPLGSVVLSTDAIDPVDRFEFWRSCFDAINEVEFPAVNVMSFAARSEQWRIGPFLVGVNRSPTHRLIRDRRHLTREDVDHWRLRMSPGAKLSLQVGDRTFVSAPGEIEVASFGAGYVADRFDITDDKWFCLIFPRDAFPDITARLDALGSGPLRSTAVNAIFGDYLLSLVSRLGQVGADQAPALAEMTRAMLTGCIREAQPSPSRSDQNRDMVRRAAVELTIRRNIGSARLDVTRICALAKVSRSSLYRMFEEEGGIATYVREMRLRLIAEDLRNPELMGETISTLATRRGFHCAASFSRSFREAYGISPREAREAIAGRAEPLGRTRRTAARPSRSPSPTRQPTLVDLLP